MDPNWGVIGHSRQINILKNIQAKNGLFQTYLFVGPESIGKRYVATRFVQCILSGSDGEIDMTHPSYAKIEHGNSDELIVLDDDKIKIKDIRKLQARLQNKVYGKMFCIFDGCENILPQAQQALLKLLEEPIENVHFIMLANSQKNVLETISSRSQVIRFSPVRSDVALQDATALEYLHRPGMVQSEDNKDIFNARAQIFFDIVKNDLIDRFQIIEKIAKDEDASELLKVWISILRHDLCAKIEGRNGAEELSKYSHKNLSRLILTFSAARSLLKRNVNKKLVLENICISL